MKKIFLVFIALIVIIIGLIYVLIPRPIIVSKIVYADVNSSSFVRCLHSDSEWQQWFPGTINSANDFTYNNQQYHLEKKLYSSINVSISANNSKYASAINVLPVNIDSSTIQWQMEFPASNNPFKIFEQYQTAKKINNNIAILLDSFKTFTKSVKNIYGFDIKFTTLTDSALVSIKTVSKQYPSTEFIYSLIDKLKKYIELQHAAEHNFPMLNITRLEDSSYAVMVGIPTNILLKGNNLIEPKRMIMLKNKTLLTTVVGDTASIKKAFEATNNYMQDLKLSTPVISFQQLVTDRRKEKDSTKWITRIFTPII